MNKIRLITIVMMALMLALALAACGQKQDAAEPSEADPGAATEAQQTEAQTGEDGSGTEPGEVIMETYIGNYTDEYSQRASLSIYKVKDGLHADINWSSSAVENDSWTMECAFDEKTKSLTYKNCIRTRNVADEEGSMEGEEIYTDGTGSFTYEDGVVRWHDDKDDAGKDCVFRVISGADDEEVE